MEKAEKVRREAVEAAARAAAEVREMAEESESRIKLADEAERELARAAAKLDQASAGRSMVVCV